MHSMFSYSCLILAVLVGNVCWSLNNGLVRTPPMGWLSWNAFGCETDCEKNPTQCLNDKQITDMADLMAEEGYLDAGYEYVIIDDCWFAPERDRKGQLQADPTRFSKGIKFVADHVHNKSMKFGIYEDEGVTTCAGYPGSLNYEEIDAQTFASWGVDYLKLDGCFVNASDMNEGFPKFRDALNKTGRPIVYSCEWPYYTQQFELKLPNYTAVKETCNVWRNWDDIWVDVTIGSGLWESLIDVLDYFDSNQRKMAAASGPGGWNDPDMLLIGGPGITEDQARAQMAIWSIWSAPLMISTDLRTLGEPFKKILLNKDVIAIDQDPLGIMGQARIKVEGWTIYVKPVTPMDRRTGSYSYAIVFFNRRKQRTINIPALEMIGLTHDKGYMIQNLFDPEPPTKLGPKDSFSSVVNATGASMYKATIVS